MTTIFETTYSNQYFWATVRVAAENEADASTFFANAVTSAEWLAAADNERSMWIEENGEFDYDAYTYRMDASQSIDAIKDDADAPIGVVSIYKGGMNG